MKDITREWIDKAEGDYAVASREIKEEKSVYDAVCFHAQQTAEKYLKALLQENDIDFFKTHDLDILLNKCKEIYSALSEYEIEMIELSSFAVEVRYPGVEAEAEDAVCCFAAASRIRDAIRKFLCL